MIPMKLIFTLFAIICFFVSNAQFRAARAAKAVDSPTVIVLIQPLYNPYPSNRTDTVWIAMEPGTSSPGTPRPDRIHQPAQKAVKGQKVFLFNNIPANYDDYILFKTAPTTYRLNLMEGGKDFTVSGDSIICKKAVTAGSFIDFRPLK